MELYLDGEASDPIEPDSELTSVPCRVVVGRLKPEPRPGGRVHSRPLVGRVDELAVYNHPLSTDEVRNHYKLGLSGRSAPH